MDNNDIDKLLSDENEQLNKLHKIVKETLLFKTLFESQEKQFLLLKEINDKLDKLQVKS